MQLPDLFRPSITATSVPPMYTWPRSLKRVLLLLAILAVIAAYVLLGGGILTFLALVAEWLGT